MPEIRHPEFRDELEFTNYPFADTASLVNDAGEFLQPDLFLDASFYVLGAAERLYLSGLHVAHDRVTLTLGDAVAARLATGDFSLTDPADSVRFLDLFGRPAGLLISTSERLASLGSWAVGDHVFSLGQTEFVASVCLPVPDAGLTGLRATAGNAIGGDVWLVGESGIVLSAVEEQTPQLDGTNVAQQVIRVDVVGDPLFRRRLCEVPDFFVNPRFVRQLIIRQGNRQFVARPDLYGDIQIGVGNLLANDTILRFRAAPEGLIVEAVGSRIE
jgi:hypothetical protein